VQYWRSQHFEAQHHLLQQLLQLAAVDMKSGNRVAHLAAEVLQSAARVVVASSVNFENEQLQSLTDA
jgi:hypothetical protein